MRLGERFSYFLERPYLSLTITVFFLVGLLGVGLVEALYLLKENLNSKRPNHSRFITKADIFVGDIPKSDNGSYDFKKMHKVHWQSSDIWEPSELLREIADQPYIWMRVELEENEEFTIKDPFALARHEGSAFDVFDDEGTHLYSFGNTEDSSTVPNQFYVRYDWIKIPNPNIKYFYIRFLHKQGFLFSITPIQNRIGDQWEILKSFAFQNILPLSFNFFFITVGLICTLIYIIEFKKKYNLVLDFASFCFLFGLFGLAKNDFFLFLLENNFYLFTLPFFASNFVFIPMLSGLRRLFGSGKYFLIDIFIFLNILIGLLVSILSLLINSSSDILFFFIEIRFALMIFSVLNIIVPVLVCYHKWRAGNREALGHTIGFSLTLILVCLEIFYAISDVSGITDLVYWGVLFGVLSQGFALERAIFSNRQKAQSAMEDLLKVEKSLKEVQLKTLQTKMSPHYLFNSLNTIHALHTFKPELVAESILRLANNYRFISDKTDRDWIRFEEEWNFLEDYLHIQKLRFFDTIQIELRKTGDFSEVSLPPLVLQPIIENSFKHGFRKSEQDQLMIFIHAKMVNQDHVNITIYDNGSGISDEVLYDESKIFGRSLGSIRERLSLLYKKFRFEIGKNFPQGTRTTLEIYLSSRVTKTHEVS